MPSKLTGMLASGKPVIATALPGTQVAEVVENAGLVVPPDNIEMLLAAIKRLADDSVLRQRLGQNARQYALQYLHKEKILSDFRQALNNL